MSLTVVGRQMVIHGDCEQELNHYKDGFFDVVVTSPPYNIGMGYSNYRDCRPNFQYLDWLRRIFEQIDRVLDPNGSFFLNMGFNSSHPMVDLDVVLIGRELFILQNRFCWVKSFAFGDNPAHGHCKPINSQRFVNRQWETVFHFTKTGNVPLDKLAIGVPYADKSNLERGNRGKHGDLRDRGDVWFLPYDTISCRCGDRGSHPATFPVSLPEHCIKLSGITPNMKVLDPFLGTGTTLVACRNLGCSGYGIEIDRSYCDFAISRLQED